MTAVDFDVVVVGAGRAGTAAAYKLAAEDFDVALVERAKQPGMKNVTGGVLYGQILADLVPEFPEEAPLERHVVEHNIKLLHGDAEVSIGYRDMDLLEEPNYTLMLGKFDRWFVDRAVDEGAVFVPETTVRDVTQARDHAVVHTDRENGDLACHAVIGADGVNTTVGRATGIQRTMRNPDMALSVKKVIDVGRDTINERFNLDSDEGAAYIYTGFPEGAPTIGYFIYTYDEYISVGAVGGLEVLRWLGDEGYAESGTPLYSLLEEFVELDTVRPYVQGESLQEYQGILLPELSYESLPDRYDRRIALVGDAAGLVLNKGYTFRGLDYGIKSGLLAAESAIACDREGNWEAFGRRYDQWLENSYVLQDMKQHRHLPEFLKNERMYGAYPGIATETLRGMYSAGSDAQGLTWKQAYRAFRNSDAGFLDLLKDGYRGLRSL
ncbi:FAD-dependent oxidoreductase [Halobacterium wangiae]|uniref:FAD-dependent oxidoreductase n=1 Tax=Halobacterium wangiae TaxID=2902623 RepID=UPI001E28AE8C|nr:FAD-dependent oxidoreductase [Halobacterium wangiae]